MTKNLDYRTTNTGSYKVSTQNDAPLEEVISIITEKKEKGNNLKNALERFSIHLNQSPKPILEAWLRRIEQVISEFSDTLSQCYNLQLAFLKQSVSNVLGM